MPVEQGFTVEHPGDYRPAFAAAAFGAGKAVFHATASVRPVHWEHSRVVDAVRASARGSTSTPPSAG